ncbi:MAG: hypothetical protein ABI361_00415 [Nitrososphaera sp.]|jgi:hypothetical protein
MTNREYAASSDKVNDFETVPLIAEIARLIADANSRLVVHGIGLRLGVKVLPQKQKRPKMFPVVRRELDELPDPEALCF